ncbi:MAG TPA: prepilin peptidase [Candidatus Angelobacter sp.]|nr:prepilin peptidase [Candidatus Angelobacter sp.]
MIGKYPLKNIKWSDFLDVFFIVAFFLFGLIFGSFLNVCIHRMPRELSVVSPRSACPACRHPIAACDNIPVVSWLLLGGKCRHCRTPISPRYAAVELLTGALFALSYYVASHGAASEPIDTSDYSVLAIAIKYSTCCFLLIGLIFTDAETKLLPDLLTKPGIALGLLFSLLVKMPEPPPLIFSSLLSGRVLSLANSIAGAAFGSAFLLGIALLYQAVRGVEGMGRGDVKLMALIGAFLGMWLTLLVLVLGTLVGTIFGILLIVVVWRKRLARRRSRRTEPASVARAKAWQSAKLIYRNFEIPFGVFLGAAALVALFFGNRLLNWYLGLYQ